MGTNQDLGWQELMMCITHAEQPREVEEFCRTLVVGLGPTGFDIINVPSVLTLVGCCQ